jgi:CRP-like cAMP-binding protein
MSGTRQEIEHGLLVCWSFECGCWYTTVKPFYDYDNHTGRVLMAHSSNLFLASLLHSDMELLRPHLTSVRLEQRHVLFNEGARVNAVYFPTNAIISLVVSLSKGRAIESAMVGRDGMAAASPALDGRTSLIDAIVQMAGYALVCNVTTFKTAALQSPTLLSSVMRHEQTLYAQAHQSIGCMALHSTEKRFCRLLLRARDLTGEDELTITQEFLADFLGVRRTSVTEVAGAFQKAGLVEYSRGKIRIIAVQELRDEACECYGTVRSHYSALLKSSTAPPEKANLNEEFRSARAP